MRRISAFLILLLFLCSCGLSPPVDEANELCKRYAEAKVTANASVTADYGDKVYVFRLRYLEEDSRWSVEVLAPDNIAGIFAHSGEDGISLEFDGVILDTGQLDPDGLTPMGALPELVRVWRTGHLENAERSKDGGTQALTLEHSLSDHALCRTVFDSATALPIRADIEYDGVCVIQCVFENVSLS